MTKKPKIDYTGITGGADNTIAGQDGFIVQFNSLLSSLESASFFGGSGAENLNAMALSTDGHIYIGGSTSSPDLPLAEQGFSPSQSSTDDGFIARFSDLDPKGKDGLYNVIMKKDGNAVIIFSN